MHLSYFSCVTVICTLILSPLLESKQLNSGDYFVCHWFPPSASWVLHIQQMLVKLNWLCKYIYYISIMCQALSWHVKWDGMCSLHNTPCKLDNLQMKKLRNSKVNYLQMINFTLEMRNYWNHRAMPSAGVQQRTWLCSGFSALTCPDGVNPQQWGGTAGACWRPGQRFVAWTALAGRVLARVPFHELKN